MNNPFVKFSIDFLTAIGIGATLSIMWLEEYQQNTLTKDVESSISDSSINNKGDTNSG